MSLIKLQETIPSLPISNKVNVRKDISNTLASLDWQTFARRQKAIFEKIKKERNDMSRQDLISILERVREHDIESGYKLSQELRITSKEYFEILNNPRFVLKHMDFMNGLSAVLRTKSEHIINQEEYNKLESNIKIFQKKLENDTESFLHMEKTYNQEDKSLLARKIISELDDVYTPLLSQITFKEPNDWGQKTKGEYIADAHLKMINKLGKYNKVSVVEMLYQRLISPDTHPKLFSERQKQVIQKLQEEGFDKTIINQLLSNDFLEKEFVSKLLIAVPTNNKQINLKDLQYKPLSLTFFTQNTLAEKYNKEELITMLQNHFGNRASLQKNNGKYEIKYNIDQQDNREIIIDAAKYKEFSVLRFIDGKMILKAQKQNDNWVVICDGQEQQGEYRQIHDTYKVVDDKVVYIGRIDGNNNVLVIDGKPGKSYNTIYSPLVSYKGKIVYLAENKKNISVVVWGEREFSEYQDATAPKVFDNKLFFTAQKGNGNWVVIENGKEVGKEYNERIEVGGYIDGKSIITVGKSIIRDGYVVYEDKKNSTYGERLTEMISLDGEIILKVKSPNSREYFFVHKNKESKQYKNVRNPIIINDKICFIGDYSTDGKFPLRAFIQDNKEMVRYPRIGVLQKNGGKVFFEAETYNQKWVVWYDGKESQKYSTIGKRKEENIVHKGVPHFIAKKDNLKYVVANTDGEESKEYEDIEYLYSISGSLYFAAKKDRGKRVIVKDGQELENTFDDIHIFKPYNGGFFWCGEKDAKLICHREGNIIASELINKEQKKLDLLNMCVHLSEKTGSLEDFQSEVNQYLKENEENSDSHTKISLDSIPKMVSNLIKWRPKLFLETISPSKNRYNDSIQKSILSTLFPELLEKKSKNSEPSIGGIYRDNKGDKTKEIYNGTEISESYLKNSFSEELLGGDPEGTPGDSKSQEILLFQDEINQVIVCNILGTTDKLPGYWQRVEFPVFGQIGGMSQETTITVPHIKSGDWVLPKPIGSTIIPQSVKMVETINKRYKKKKTESEINYQTNSLGMDQVHIDKKSGEIKYSLSIPLDIFPIENISSANYQKFKENFEKLWGKKQKSSKIETGMVDIILDFDIETDLFVESIHNLPIKEQIIQIEAYVKKYAYYDNKNKEVIDRKIGRPNQERLFLCEQRIQELKYKNPEMESVLNTKKWAGVCADFALITTGILRKAGILSGILRGFLPSGKSVTLANAHGCSFAVLPTKSGENKIVVIDGTPHGSPIQPFPSVGEQEKKTEKNFQKLQQETLQKLSDLSDILTRKNGDGEIDQKIKENFNGSLKEIMNTLLYNQVEISHYQTIANILDAYWYSPIYKKDINVDKEDILNFISDQKDNKPNTEETFKPHEAGTKLFEIIESSFKKSQEKNGLNGINNIEEIVDSLAPKLTKIEYTATKLVIDYLKIKNNLH